MKIYTLKKICGNATPSSNCSYSDSASNLIASPVQKKDKIINKNKISGYTVQRVYKDMRLQKKQIIEDNKGKCGIYVFTNKITGRRYVGSSLNLGRRLRDYYSNIRMLNTLQRSTMVIYLAILKYEISAFELEILEYCDPSVVRARETYYIKSLNPEYNILRTGGSSLGYKHSIISCMKMSKAALGRKHSEETRALIRESALLRKRSKHSEETRAKMSKAALGRKHSEETRAKLRAKLKKVGLGRKLSIETRAKMSKAALGRVLSEETRARLSELRKGIGGKKV